MPTLPRFQADVRHIAKRMVLRQEEATQYTLWPKHALTGQWRRRRTGGNFDALNWMHAAYRPQWRDKRGFIGPPFGPSCYRHERVRNFSMRLRRLTGPTLLLTIAFAPLVVYPFWLHFQDYSGPMWALLLPIPFPIIAGVSDHKLSAFQCAALLAGGAYTFAVANSIREVFFSGGHWTDVIATLVFAAFWFSTAILLPTMLLVMVGRVSRGLLKPRRTH